MSAFVAPCRHYQTGTGNKPYQMAIVIYTNGIRCFHHFMSLGMNEREQVGHVYPDLLPVD